LRTLSFKKAHIYNHLSKEKKRRPLDLRIMLCSNLATQYPQTTRIHIPKQIVNAMLPFYIKHKVIHKHGVLEKKRNI
jgi:hypothetical protein